MGKETDGKALVAATEDKLRRTARENPAFATKTVSILLACSGKVGVYTTSDTRMQVVTEMGLKPSPFAEKLGTDDYFVDVSPGRRSVRPTPTWWSC